ncbi:MAG: glycerate kinase [Clostridiales bacterium]|nr:glycerate kinase [Clostridiales bacterium]
MSFNKLNSVLADHARQIYTHAITKSLPDNAVKNALCKLTQPKGKLICIAIGKAAWQMANAAVTVEHLTIHSGAVITKYGHSNGSIPNLDIFEAGHPVPDENGLSATRKVLEITKDLTEDDVVLFFISGGGSALFEDVCCSLSQLQDITSALLASGASIDEINCIRKHLSNVKGGRFAEHCKPAKVFAVALSDVLGDRLDTIASGPACADSSTSEQALAILNKYAISVCDDIVQALNRETPKLVTNSEHVICGSVSALCKHAKEKAEELGYVAKIVSDNVTCQAKDMGKTLADVVIEHKNTSKPLAIIYGGETVVKLNGNGKGGRNQELALWAAKYINGIDNVAVFSVGSDGTDGPTDAAGGIAFGTTWQSMINCGLDPQEMLNNNDSYNALKQVGSLIITGPTGTNVNDLYVALILPKGE